MKIGDRCFVHGYVDEIRKDTVIVRNKGGYFGTDPGEVIVVNDMAHPNWIPCSERLPDNYDYQLLTEEVHYTTGKIVRCVLIAYYDDEDDVWMSAEESPEAISYPIAWMPLPKPYWGGEKEG